MEHLIRLGPVILGNQLVERVGVDRVVGHELAEPSVEDLPALTARLERLVAETEAVVRSYGSRSDFNVATLSALREVQNAAKSISELARAIERSPNSLIFGR